MLPAWTTTSFSAGAEPRMGLPCRYAVASSRKRGSMVYSPRNTALSFASICAGEMSARKPKPPRLTPSTGTPAEATSRATPRMLPSPPTTTTRSASSPIASREMPSGSDNSAAVSASTATSTPVRRSVASTTFSESATCGLPGLPTSAMRSNSAITIPRTRGCGTSTCGCSR